MSERKKKILKGLAYLLIAVVVLPTLLQKRGRTDLGLLREAATRLWAHEEVYDLGHVNEHTKPPLATLVSLVLLVIPQALQERLWDLINILAFLAWGRRYANSRRHLLLGVLFTLNAFNAEIRLGQYNLLTLWGMIWAAQSKHPARGLGLLLAILFKPVNVILLPWVWKQTPHRKSLIVSAGVSLVVLGALYVGLFGGEALWKDHLTWYRFLPGSVSKHIFRDDNYGLPSLTAQAGLGPLTNFWLFGGLALALAVPNLLVGVILTIVVSPMAWLQNYSLLLGSNLTWLDRYSRTRSGRVAVALGLIYVFHQGWNPTLKPFLGWLGQMRPPLLALLAASLLVVVDLRLSAQSDKKASSD